jgi:hypothetical protein
VERNPLCIEEQHGQASCPSYINVKVPLPPKELCWTGLALLVISHSYRNRILADIMYERSAFFVKLIESAFADNFW